MARDVADLDGGAARAASIMVTNICTNERASRGSDGLSANIKHSVAVVHEVKGLAEHDASGVSKITPNGVPKSKIALHTVIGRNSRRRKGLKPSRRLSETTGPQSPNAFRIAFPTAEVTKRGASCKTAAPVSTHRAPTPRRYRSVTDAVHTLP